MNDYENPPTFFNKPAPSGPCPAPSGPCPGLTGLSALVGAGECGAVDQQVPWDPETVETVAEVSAARACACTEKTEKTEKTPDTAVQIAGWGAKRKRKKRDKRDDEDAHEELTDIVKTACEAMAKNLYNLSLVHPFVARDGEDLRAFIQRIGPPKDYGVVAGFKNAGEFARDIRKIRRAAKEIAQSSTMQDASKDLLASILVEKETAKVRALCAMFDM